MPQHPTTHPPHALEAVFERYHASWMARDAERIASLHSQDTVFQMHDGSSPVVGRTQLKQHCETVFSRFDFTLEPRQVLFGDSHWVLEWSMEVALRDTAGQPFNAKVDMLDVVTVDSDGQVRRKDVYVNGAQFQAAFRRAGIDVAHGIQP
jgi:uncharacterized protein (TIGR02246 family)